LSDGDGTVDLGDGLGVGIARYGDPGGRPVIWNHGGLSCRLDAAPLDAAARASGIRLVALDRPGIGNSSRALASGFGAWARTVGRVADLEGFDRFAVAGWSAGGAFAMACARHLPDRVTATFLVASMYPVDDPARRAELGLVADRVLIPLSARSPSVADGVLRLARLLPARSVVRSMLRMAGTRDGAAMEAMEAGSLAAMVRGATWPGPSGTVADYRTFGGAWGFALGTLPGPVRMWQGEEDPLVPLAHARRLADAIVGTDLVTVPRCGHFVHFAVPGELAEAMASAPG